MAPKVVWFEDDRQIAVVYAGCEAYTFNETLFPCTFRSEWAAVNEGIAYMNGNKYCHWRKIPGKFELISNRSRNRNSRYRKVA